MKPLAILLLLTLQAEQPVDCETIRSYVALHGKIKSYAWALSQGYSPKEISRIRKQCGI